METKIPHVLNGKLLALVCLAFFGLAIFLPKAIMPRITADTEDPEPSAPPRPEKPTLVVQGKTQCILTRKFTIAPVPLHPVTEVLVEPGSQVKKGQCLVKLDDDEQQAEVRAKQAALENAKIMVKEAVRHHKQAIVGYQSGALPEKTYYETQVGALKAERDERSAQAALEAAKAELEHYEVTSQIDGVVSWLDVHPGMVSRPGTTVWGEILDLREINILCELTFDQVDQLSIGQTAEIKKKQQKEVLGIAHVISVGIAADKKTGLIPVFLRMANPECKLRCEEPVEVIFAKPGSPLKKSK